MRFRAIAFLILAGACGLIYAASHHKITLSAHTFGENLGISLLALVALCALWGVILGGDDKK